MQLINFISQIKYLEFKFYIKRSLKLTYNQKKKKKKKKKEEEEGKANLCTSFPKKKKKKHMYIGLWHFFEINEKSK